MDEPTLFTFKPLWGKEPQSKRCLSELHGLTETEQHLFEALKNNVFTDEVRLEQERIQMAYVLKVLNL